jgi:hypothetical protein
MEINSNNSNNDDNLKRDYYYYSDVNTKIEVRYRKNENGNDEKITKTYLIENYPSDICNKIKERQKWAKFGQAVNENNKSLSNFTDTVEFEINTSLTHFYYKKNNENININNTRYYIDSEQSSSSSFSTSSSNSFNMNKPKNNDDELNIFDTKKKSLVNCRYCGENTHWSIQCPSKKEEKEIKEKKEKEENEAMEKQKYIEKEKEKYEKRKSNIGLKISDLDESLTESEIRYHFEQFGTIINFFMVRNKKNRKFNGSVYITYLTPEENNNALINIRTKHLNYLIPSVELAKPKEIY